MSQVQTLAFCRRNLPHWLVAEHTFFVTIRLHGTLPKTVVQELRDERERVRGTASADQEMPAVLRRQLMRIEALLDAGDPRRNWLIREEVASVLLERLAWLADEAHGWNVYAATVMSNHMHLLLRNTAGRSALLLKDIGQYKRQTAYQSNCVLHRTGTFWAREDFDHWCRDESKVLGAIRYIAQNPVKAGLCACWRDWPWTMIQESWIKRAQL